MKWLYRYDITVDLYCFVLILVLWRNQRAYVKSSALCTAVVVRCLNSIWMYQQDWTHFVLEIYKYLHSEWWTIPVENMVEGFQCWCRWGV
jgi:hypothetical protein